MRAVAMTGGPIESDLVPFVILPVWLLTTVSTRAVQVYAVMAARADNDSGLCYPTVTTIATDAGCSVDAVRRAHRELEEAGALVIYPNQGPGAEGMRPNRYRIQGRTNPPSKSASTDPLPPSTDARPPLARMPGRTRSIELERNDAPLRSASLDAEQAAKHLADRIGNNGARTPTVTPAWVAELDRMHRIDGRSWDEIRGAIDWSQSHEFWASVILSPKKLRAKYDQMLLQAKRKPQNPAESKFTRARQIADAMDRDGITVDQLLGNDTQRKGIGT